MAEVEAPNHRDRDHQGRQDHPEEDLPDRRRHHCPEEDRQDRQGRLRIPCRRAYA